MSILKTLWNTISHRIISSPRHTPSAITIPADHVDQAASLGGAFLPNQHYFQVRINELFLTNAREWFSTIDPMVFVVSEFLYDRQEQEVPCIVGPGMMQKYAQKLEKVPQGMLFRDTRVAGVHPYRGGRLSLTVVLCQTESKNYARELLKVVETASSALDFSTALTSYVKVGSAVLDGFQALLGLGATQPLVGLRREFDPDAGDHFVPGFFALIDKPNVDPNRLWVRNHQLMTGSSLDTATTSYRDADFVLYSIVHPADNKRTELEQLSFYALWDRVASEAAVPKEDNWLSAKANMTSLYQALLVSPDLTQPHADELAEAFRNRAKIIHQNALKNAAMGSAKEQAPTMPQLDAARSRSLSVLND